MATPIIERFMKFVSPEPNSGCWLWTGSISEDGYGKFKMTQAAWAAHRVSYELFVGPIPEGLQIDHLCRVRCCVNPKHLEPVTLQENFRRGIGNAHGAAAASIARISKTHCLRGHEYVPDNVMIQADGARRCRTCDRKRAREYQRAKRGYRGNK